MPPNSSPLRFELSDDGIAVIALQRPPVNAMSLAMVQALREALDAFEADAEARALLVYGEGRTFIAGADIAEFDAPRYDLAPLLDLYRRLEDQVRPVVVCWHGTALGAGLEIGLAAHHRVALPGTRLGLPEVSLGLLPGGQGTQRLPRLVGVPAALSLMLQGQPLDAEAARDLGLVDSLAAEGLSPREAGLAAARRLLASAAPLRRSRALALPDRSDAATQAALEAARTLAATRASEPAVAAIVRCVEAALALDYDAAAAIEAREFEALRVSPESTALRRQFFAQREAARLAKAARAAATDPTR